MTVISTAIQATQAPALSEFTGGGQSTVDFMVGIGVNKDSDAVFFTYLGEEQKPQPLLNTQTGNPITKLAPITISGISIATDIGEFKAEKLNVFIQSSVGSSVMLTSGLSTFWSQAIIVALMGLMKSESLDLPVELDSWKGTSSMKPIFAAIKLNGQRVSDQKTYDNLSDARGDKNYELVKTILRNSVAELNHAITGGPIEEVEVVESTAPTEEF